MNCPICQTECYAIRQGSTIGRLPGRPELDLKQVIGYDCPNKTTLPHDVKVPHFTTRGGNETVILGRYRVSTWLKDPDREDSKGCSTIYALNGDDQFTEVCQTPIIKWDTEEKMLEKIAIYVLFS